MLLQYLHEHLVEIPDDDYRTILVEKNANKPDTSKHSLLDLMTTAFRLTIILLVYVCIYITESIIFIRAIPTKGLNCIC